MKAKKECGVKLKGIYGEHLNKQDMGAATHEEKVSECQLGQPVLGSLEIKKISPCGIQSCFPSELGESESFLALPPQAFL